MSEKTIDSAVPFFRQTCRGYRLFGGLTRDRRSCVNLQKIILVRAWSSLSASCERANNDNVVEKKRTSFAKAIVSSDSHTEFSSLPEPCQDNEKQTEGASSL